RRRLRRAQRHGRPEQPAVAGQSQQDDQRQVLVVHPEGRPRHVGRGSGLRRPGLRSHRLGGLMFRGTLSRYRWRNTAIAGSLAVAGALLVLLYVASYRHNVQTGAKLVPVYVASRDIPEGTSGASVAGSYLKKETVLRRNVVDGAISSPSQIATLAASGPILAGEQVTVRQFHPAAEQGVLANISGNLRAMTLSGDPNQLLAGVVADGDHVDVIANISY